MRIDFNYLFEQLNICMMERKSPVFPIIILVANFLKVILKFIKISLLALKKKKKKILILRKSSEKQGILF